MDIHKPKPWHSWREFLKEYGIIVLGVLTALAAEQAVEWLHWRERVAQTEDVLLPEVQFNLSSSYDRIIAAPCLGQRIAAFRDALLKPGPDWKGMALTVTRRDPAQASLADWARSGASIGASVTPLIYPKPSRPWREGVWASAVASGVFDHMSRNRAAAFARIYRGFEQMRELQKEEDDAVARIEALGYDRKLTEPEKTQFLSALGTLNNVNVKMASYGAQILLDADANGLRVKASDAKASIDRSSNGLRARCYVAPKLPLAPG